MDYISGGSQTEEVGFYRRFSYPIEYKVNKMYITKFDRNLGSQLDYQFINAFPKGMTAIPVSYGGADLLKVTVSFNYDRYIVNSKGSGNGVSSGGVQVEGQQSQDEINARNLEILRQNNAAYAQRMTILRSGGDPDAYNSQRGY